MTQILIYFLVGISLSIDAFSLALSLGTTSPKLKIILKTSIIVGLFHFCMPVLGDKIGLLLSSKILIGTNYLSFLLFLILGVEMIYNENSERKRIELKNITIILLALTVSMDSLTVGVAFGLNQENIYLASSIFSIVSGLSTGIGLFVGKKFSNEYQKEASTIGIIILLLVALKYLLNI